MGLKHKCTQTRAHISTLNKDTQTHAHRAFPHPLYQFLISWVPIEKLGTLQVFSFKLQVLKYTVQGEHISLNPVSKVDGILAKIFIYNILQQRLDRLLLAVLRRKRGRSVHEWDCRLGWGSAGEECRGRSWGPGKQENTSKRQEEKTPPTAGS